MTIEDAITQISVLKYFLPDIFPKGSKRAEKLDEALELSIQALKEKQWKER